MSGPFAMGNGSCLLSLKLHSFLRRTASLRPPALRILLCFHGYRPAWTTSTWGTQFAKVTSLFRYRLRHPYHTTAFGFVHTVERSRSTLAHSSNCRSVTDCVRSILSNRKSKASLGLQLVPVATPLFLRCAATTAHRQTPFSCYDEEARPSPLEPVTCACRLNRTCPEGWGQRAIQN